MSQFSRSRHEQFRAAVVASLAGSSGLALSFSHDPYLAIVGGLQNCIGLEQRAFRTLGWSYLHLCPYRPLPILADPVPIEEFEVIASLDGAVLGVLPLRAVADILARYAAEPIRRTAIVHHLLGHSPELVRTVIDTMQPEKLFFWIHDLFAHCPSVHLLRNDESFCGGPPLDSGACRICHAGAERKAHVARFSTFFAALRPHLLAPSQTILDKWLELRNYDHAGATVLPPCRLEPAGAVEPSAGTLKVGFLGTGYSHKGWDIFATLALWLADDPRYRFYQLSSQPDPLPCVAHRPVTVTPEDPEAMARAVLDCGLDIVINWSLCYESFSFTTIEAIAGGAFLIARSGSGNVVPLLRSIDPALGIAVASLTELQALFVTGDIITLARNAPRRAGSLVMGSGTATLQEAV